jgi:NADH pyrophosphatase NudC (nudix superfamily)
MENKGFKYCPQCGAGIVTQWLDGTDRLQCEQVCGYVHWDNPTPVVAAIVEYEGQVLLARNAAWPEDWFALVTGFLEKGETPESAVIREVEEELGLSGIIEEFVGNYSFFKMNQLLIVFHVKASGTIQLNEELAAYKLLDKDKVQPWDLGTGPALRDWLASQLS